MHPIIDIFLNTNESIPKIIRKYKPLKGEEKWFSWWIELSNRLFDKNNFTTKQPNKSTKKANQKKQFTTNENITFFNNFIKQDIIIKDNNLNIFFYVMLGTFAYKNTLIDEAKLISLRFKKIPDKSTPPGLLYLAEAFLRYVHNNYFLDLHLMVDLIVRHSKKHSRIMIIGILEILAHQGMYKDGDHFLKLRPKWRPSEFNQNHQDQIKLYQLINDIETGRDNPTFDLVLKKPRLLNSITQTKEQHELTEWIYTRVIKLIRNQPIDFSVGQYSIRENEIFEKSLLLMKINYAISNNDLTEVAKLLKVLITTDSKTTSPYSFLSYTEVRAEIVLKNYSAAAVLMEKFSSKINKKHDHFINNFFLARIELLKKNTALASNYYSKLIKNVAHYNAYGRLNLELRLAKELKLSDLHEIIIAKVSNHAPPKLTPNIKPKKLFGSNRLIGKSKVMKKLRQSIIRYGELETPVLIIGETGAGKEVIATALHEESSRRKGPFVAINCSAIVDSLLQTELFGHVTGAYTSANKGHEGIISAAGKGTLFLDEIGDISPSMQSALLRVLETGEYRPVGSTKIQKLSCRIIMATNVDLEKSINEGTFRLDLYYRLKRLDIVAPPLRDRIEDILLLTNHFINSIRNDGQDFQLTPSLEKALNSYQWPGNVRELKNLTEKSILLNSQKSIYDQEDFSFLSNIQYKESPALIEEPTRNTSISQQSQSSDANEELGSRIAKAKHLINTGKNSLRRLEQIRELFREHNILTRLELVKTMDLNPSTTTTDLKKLQEEGFLEKIEPSKSPRTHYFKIL